MMKSISFVIILLAISSWSTAQQTITGKVINEAGFPMLDIIVCQVQTNRCTLTKSDGSYRLTLDTESPGVILFGHKGYISLIYALKPGEVILPDLVVQKDTAFEGIADQLRDNQKFGMELVFDFPLYQINFSEFSTFLGNKNTDLLESDKPHINVGIHVLVQKANFGIGFGRIQRENDRHDSIGRKFTSHLLAIKTSYSLIENKTLSLGPEVGIGWAHRRLQNFPIEDKIPMEQYLKDKNLDLRFHDFLATVGLNLSVKVLTSKHQFYNYVSIGLSGGYLAQLSKSAIIRSSGNRLMTNLRAPYEPYYLNFSISIGM